MITRKQLNRIFYIYTEASLAVFTFIGGVIELLAGLALVYGYNNPIGYIGIIAFPCFMLVTLLNCLYIYRKEAK